MSLIPRENWFDMDRLFHNFFPAETHDKKSKFFAPRVDITDKSDHFEIVGELPGVKREDIDVQLHNGCLTIEAKVHEEKKSEQDKVIRKERRSGFYSRSFALDAGVHEDEISAKFEDGLLTITAPKHDKKIDNKRKISIE